MKFFKGPIIQIDSVRVQVMQLLDQPNGHAREPWKEGGDFNNGVEAYVALGLNHITGSFSEMFDHFLQTPGVEEIDEATYRAAMPNLGKSPDLD